MINVCLNALQSSLFAADSFSKIKLCVVSFGWPFNGIKTIGKFSSGLPCTYVHLHFLFTSVLKSPAEGVAK